MSFFGRRFRVTLWQLFLLLSTTGFATAYVVTTGSPDGSARQSALDRLNAGAATEIIFNVTPTPAPAAAADFGLATPLLSYKQDLLDAVTRPAAFAGFAAPESKLTSMALQRSASTAATARPECAPPTFTLGPADTTICNSVAMLTVSASGATGYQWQSSPDNISWTDISGAASSTYNASPSVTTMYRAVALSGCGNTTSNGATVTVQTVSITAQPVDTAVCSGGNASFSVTALNATGYQWESSSDGINFVAIGGATASAYTETNTSPGFGYYRVQVYGCSNVTSNVASYTVTPGAVFVMQPSSGSSCANTTTVLNALANNSTGYQWQSSPDGINWTDISGQTSSVYNATPAVTTNYRVLAYGSCGAAPSNTATLTVTPLPSISTQPTNATACLNTTVSFSVAANNATGYQWELSNDSVNWSPIGGATNSTYAFVYAGAPYFYRAAVQGCQTVYSNTVTVTAGTIPTILGGPASTSVCAGSNATLSVSATGASGVYQWQSSTGGPFTDIAGATGPALTDAPLVTTQYQVIVYGSCGSTIAGPATITVTPMPAVVVSPSNQTFCTPATVQLLGNATSATSYQWQSSADGINWTAVANTTFPQLTANVSVTTQYRFLAFNSCGSATSNAAIISITGAPTITTQPQSVTACPNSNVTFSVAASNASSYQWEISNDSVNWSPIGGATGTTYTFNYSGLPFFYRAAVTGCSTVFSNTATVTAGSTPTITGQPAGTTACAGSNVTLGVTATNAIGYQWQSSPDGINWSAIGGATAPTYSFVAPANTTQYQVVVAGSCGSNTSAPATVTITPLPTITTQPSSQTHCGAGIVVLSAAALNATSYQWQSSPDGLTWTSIGAATGTTFNTTVSVTTQYRMLATNTCGTTPSNAAIVTVSGPPQILTQPQSATACLGGNVTFSVVASGATSYQWQISNDSINWSPIGGATLASYSFANPGTPFFYRVAAIGCSTALSNAVTVTTTAPPTITTQPSNATACAGTNVSFSVVSPNATSYVWEQSTNGGASFTPISGGTGTTLSTTATAGTLYHVIVTNSCGSLTSNAVSTTITGGAVINSQPAGTTACAGTNVTLSVGATGALGYQWQSSTGAGFTNIAGATTSTLSFPAPATTTQYQVVITGSCGSITSAPAIVTVTPAASITTQPASTSACAGTKVSFSVSATNALSYIWQSSSNGTFVDIAGATASTLTITAPSVTTQYRAVVTGACGSVTSNAANLTISSIPPSISTQPTSVSVCPGAQASFNVVANGTGLTYQWMKDNFDIPNANSATYSIGSVSPLDQGTYAVKVGSSCFASVVISNGAKLTVNAAPVITIHPANFIGCANDTASFTVGASGLGLTYQWFVNSKPISGATGSSFTAPAPLSNGTVSVTISNTCGAAQASASMLISPPTVSFTVALPTSNSTVPPGKVLLIGTGTCAGPPTGNVTLVVGGVSLGTRFLSAGMALFDFNGSGSDFTVTYSGDPSYPPATVTAAVTGAAIPFFDDRVLLLLAAAMAVAGIIAMRRS